MRDTLVLKISVEPDSSGGDKVIDEQSLYQTVINASSHMLLGNVLALAERARLAAWLLAHQNGQRGFSFYPTAAEREHGIRLMSGEKLRTLLAADNVVEMETLRLLALLQPDTPKVNRLFERAERRLSGVCYGRVCSKGECAHASISVLRYHTARDVEKGAAVIARGLEVLYQDRAGEGAWRSFPFYYTLLWLAELHGEHSERARAELSYARGRCERLLSRIRPGIPGKPFDRARERILRDALVRVGGTAGARGVVQAWADGRTGCELAGHVHAAGPREAKAVERLEGVLAELR
jgi:hypothetical protein